MSGTARRRGGAYRDALAAPGFRPYLAGALSSQMGDAMAALGFLLLVFQTTGSAAMTTGVLIAEATPYVLFGLVGGALGDRLPKLPTLLALDATRAVLQAGTCLAVLVGEVPYAALLAVVFALQLAGCVFNPTHRALMPELLPRGAWIAGGALLGLGQTAAPLAGPAVAAAALATVGPAGFLAIDALTYVISVLCLLRLRRRCVGGTASAARGRLTDDLRAFLAMARHDPTLRALLATTFAAVALSTWARQVGLLFLCARAVGDDADRLYATLIGLHALAALTSGLLLPLVAERLALRHYRAAAAAWGLGILLSALPLGVAGLAAAVVFQGTGVALAGASRAYLLQTELPDHMRGEGLAAAATILYLADLVSFAVFGALATLAPVPVLVAAAGLALVLAACARLVPRHGVARHVAGPLSRRSG